MLHREGFLNVVWQGAHGSDRGRDIVCERHELWGPKLLRHKCIVQCKKYAGHLSRALLHEDLLKAAQFKPDYFIVATTGIISSALKDWLFTSSDKNGIRIVLWERTDLERLLEYHQDLRVKYLGGEPGPDFLTRHLALIEGARSQFDCKLLTAEAKLVLGEACLRALHSLRPLTTALLIGTLLEKDLSYSRALFERCRVDVDPLIAALFGSVAPLEEDLALRVGLRSSGNANRVLEKCMILKGCLADGGFISTRALLIACLHVQPSRTNEFLKSQCGSNVVCRMQELSSEGINRGVMDALFRLADEHATTFVVRASEGETVFHPLSPWPMPSSTSN